MNGVMRRVAGICLFTIGISFAAFGQLGTIPAKWIGSWKLNVEKSTFGVILVPSPPADFKILSQTLRIEQAGTEIGISAEGKPVLA